VQETEHRDKQRRQEAEETEKSHWSLVQTIKELQERAAKAEETAALAQTRATRTREPSSSDSLLEEERKELRTKVLCPVCTTRERNLAISKCGHVFCRQCITQNLAKRNRKCPACGLTYGGESDLCAVYL